MPKGVGTARPPAKSLAPRTVWQSLQLPMAARSRPRLTNALSKDCGAGGSTAAIAGRHTIAATAIAPAMAAMAMIPPIVRGDAMVVRLFLNRIGASLLPRAPMPLLH
jgi:hypothetical protein